MRSAPPASISIAVANNPDEGSPTKRENTEPVAQHNEPTITTAAPSGSIWPPPANSPGPTSSAMPARPSANPETTPLVGRGPPGRAQSTSTIHSGTIATSSAVTPD